MPNWPDQDETLINEFVKQLNLACYVSRFLDWLTARGIIPANPSAELRRNYECRSSAAVLRALASAQPTKALELLRPTPRYASHLGPIMRGHVNRMRTLGLR